MKNFFAGHMNKPLPSEESSLDKADGSSLPNSIANQTPNQESSNKTKLMSR